MELLGEEIQVALAERIRRVDHVLTKDERERQAKWSTIAAPRWDYVPSGTLALSIKELAGTGVRRTWQDGRRRQAEDMLNDVLAGLAVVAEAKRVERLERERRRERARPMAPVGPGASGPLRSDKRRKGLSHCV